MCYDKTLNQQCMLAQPHPLIINHLNSLVDITQKKMENVLSAYLDEWTPFRHSRQADWEACVNHGPYLKWIQPLCMIWQYRLWAACPQGFFQLFAQGGTKWDYMDYLGEGGKYVCMRVQSMWQTRGARGHAPLGNFGFGPFIRHNLVKSGTGIIYHLLCHLHEK